MLINQIFGFGAEAAAFSVVNKVLPPLASAASFATGGSIRQIMTGGIVGGLAGEMTSDEATSTGKFRDVLAGAGIGAVGMGAVFGAGRLLKNPEGWKGMGEFALNRIKSGAILKAGMDVGNIGLRMGTFALNNPRASVLLGAAGLGMASLAMSGREESLSNEQLAQNAAALGPSTGFAPGMGGDFRALRNSTDGLTQGLHRGRHK